MSERDDQYDELVRRWNKMAKTSQEVTDELFDQLRSRDDEIERLREHIALVADDLDRRIADLATALKERGVSWDIYLEDESGKTVTVARHEDGGTFAVGGTTDAELNVTYNYGKHFKFRELDGHLANETMVFLGSAVGRLGTIRDSEYWKPTEGNVGAACATLLEWAKIHPGARWRVS